MIRQKTFARSVVVPALVGFAVLLTQQSCVSEATGMNLTDTSWKLVELAGVPAEVLERARELVQAPEEQAVATSEGALGPPPPRGPQMGLFAAPAQETPLSDRLRDLAVDQLRPIDALVLLGELVDLVKEPKSPRLA